MLGQPLGIDPPIDRVFTYSQCAATEPMPTQSSPFAMVHRARVVESPWLMTTETYTNPIGSCQIHSHRMGFKAPDAVLHDAAAFDASTTSTQVRAQMAPTVTGTNTGP